MPCFDCEEKNKDQNTLRNLLKENSGKDNYSEIEKYILSKVKELVLSLTAES